MLIRVRSSLGIWKLQIASADPTVLEIKQEIEKQQHVPFDEQIIVFKGTVPDDSSSISALNLGRDDMLELDGRIEKETIAKSFIDDKGVLVQAGAKVVTVAPSGNYSKTPPKPQEFIAQPQPERPNVIAESKSGIVSPAAKAAVPTPSPAISAAATPSPALSRDGTDAVSEPRSGSTPALSAPEDDTFNYNDFDFGDAKDDFENAEGAVRSPIAAKRMVLVGDDDEEDARETYGGYQGYGYNDPFLTSVRNIFLDFLLIFNSFVTVWFVCASRRQGISIYST
jgi:hypothetical protein